MAARFCPQCGREVSSAAKFCPHCGASLSPGGASARVSPVETAARGTRRLLLPLALAAVLALTVAVVLLLRRPATPLVVTRTVPLAVPAAMPVTNAPTVPAPAAPPVTNAPSTGPGQLPPDVAAYLKFLQGIETQRVALSNDTSGATAMLAQAHQMQAQQQAAQQQDASDPDAPGNGNPQQTQQGSVAKISGGFTDYNAKWQTLVADFRAQTPPPACADLANQYFNFLSGYAKVISQLQVALLNGDIGAAMSAQGAQAQINAQALQADGSLAQLCAHYNAPKPFSIQPDGASSSLLGQ